MSPSNQQQSRLGPSPNRSFTAVAQWWHHVPSQFGLFLLMLFAIDVVLFNAAGGGALCAICCIGYHTIQRFYAREPVRSYHASCAKVAALVLVLIATSVVFNGWWGKTQADHIIEAVERYKTNHGTYPTTLQAITPDYMIVIPPSGVKLMWGYDYMKGTDGYTTLSWTVGGIGEYMQYHFEREELARRTSSASPINPMTLHPMRPPSGSKPNITFDGVKLEH